jgi:hypothetical protein
VAANTRNQAFAAILFLYEKVLQIELPNIHAMRARQPEWLPGQVQRFVRRTRVSTAVAGLACFNSSQIESNLSKY